MTKSPNGTNDPAPDYLTYLLRLWRMRGEGAAGWRASLAAPGSGERYGFASLDDLFLFLRRETSAGSEKDNEEDRPK
jgi:hypothetical protein